MRYCYKVCILSSLQTSRLDFYWWVLVFCSGFSNWKGIFEAAQGVSKVLLNGFSFVAVICLFDLIFYYVGNVFVLFFSSKKSGNAKRPGKGGNRY